MNKYRIDDVFVGLEESFSCTITEEMMNSFRETTQDLNPLHNSTLFANDHGYSDKVVFGMLTSSFLSTLAGVYLPGELSMILGIDIEFPKPVYVNDTLVVKGVVKEVNKDFQYIVIKTPIVNQKLEKVLRGKMRIGFLRES